MTISDRLDAHLDLGAGTSWSRELVQARADDVVLAAALFKPNAAGSRELTLGAGFGQRQLLKAGRVGVGTTRSPNPTRRIESVGTSSGALAGECEARRCTRRSRARVPTFIPTTGSYATD